MYRKKQVYVLKLEGKVIYVGITVQKLNNRKSNGYRKIPDEIVKQCTIEAIDTVNSKEEEIKERQWIEFYRQTNELYNITNGLGFDYIGYQKEYLKGEKWRIYQNEKGYRHTHRIEYNEYMREYMKNYRKRNG